MYINWSFHQMEDLGLQYWDVLMLNGVCMYAEEYKRVTMLGCINAEWSMYAEEYKGYNAGVY